MTDERLKEYLSLAAVQDFRAVMDTPCAGEAESCSLPCRHWQKKILADPRRWCRERQKPVWMRAARRAACFLLAGAAAFGTLLAASPTARAAVTQWFRTVFAEHAVFYQGSDAAPAEPARQTELKDEDGSVIGTVTEVGNMIVTEYDDPPEDWGGPEDDREAAAPDTAFSASSEPTDAAEDEYTIVLDPKRSRSDSETFDTPPQYAPTWLPEGFRLSRIDGGNSYLDGNQVCAWLYEEPTGFLHFFADQSSAFSLAFMDLTEDMRQSAAVNGRPADFYDGENRQYLFWDNGSAFFRLETLSSRRFEKETLIKIAESVQKVTLPHTYSMKWMPEGSRLMVGDTRLPGGSYEQLADGRDFYFTFLYSNGMAGPHSAEGSDPEPVAVNGCSGAYYAAAGPLDEYSGYTRRTYGDDAVKYYYKPRYTAAVNGRMPRA